MHIPGEITEHERGELNAALRTFLRVLRNDGRPLWASCRLNRTGTTHPVFIAWVETAHGASVRRANNHPHPPSRFGDEHVSSLFRQCLNPNQTNQVVSRNWARDHADNDSLEIGRKWYGEEHRRSMAITVGANQVGTLNVGFAAPPSSAVDREFPGWAQDQQSELVDAIREILR